MALSDLQSAIWLISKQDISENNSLGVLSEGKRGIINAINLNAGNTGIEIQGFEDARALDLANEKRPTPEMKNNRKK